MKRMKQWICMLLVAAMVVSIAGCGSTGSETNTGSAANETAAISEDANEAEETDSDTQSSDGMVTITDHAGNVVEVPLNCERIVVCDILPLPSVLSVFFDSAEKIVGMSEASMTAAQNSLLSELYPEILNASTDFIDGSNVNIEELMKLEPDVVFYSAGSPQIGEQLAKAGIPGVAISPAKWEYDAIETLDNWILLLSQIFPENDRAQIVEEYSAQVYDRVQERVSDIPDEERERIFFLFQYSDTMITTSGQKFFGQWWADAIGAINVGEEMETDNSTEVSMEQIYAWNPQHILITNFNAAQPEDLYNNTIGSYDWSEIDAVKNHKVDKMPLGMYRSYTCGVDTPVTLLWLAKTVYPDLFSDIDITEETKEYYKAVFDIELTDEQAEQIFTPISEASAF
jgi:iron complex transport system substrate-binding protein